MPASENPMPNIGTILEFFVLIPPSSLSFYFSMDVEE
jgi:hypothetical protein